MPAPPAEKRPFSTWKNIGQTGGVGARPPQPHPSISAKFGTTSAKLGPTGRRTDARSGTPCARARAHRAPQLMGANVVKRLVSPPRPSLRGGLRRRRRMRAAPDNCRDGGGGCVRAAWVGAAADAAGSSTAPRRAKQPPRLPPSEHELAGPDRQRWCAGTGGKSLHKHATLGQGRGPNSFGRRVPFSGGHAPPHGRPSPARCAPSPRRRRPTPRPPARSGVWGCRRRPCGGGCAGPRPCSPTAAISAVACEPQVPLTPTDERHLRTRSGVGGRRRHLRFAGDGGGEKQGRGPAHPPTHMGAGTAKRRRLTAARRADAAAAAIAATVRRGARTGSRRTHRRGVCCQAPANAAAHPLRGHCTGTRRARARRVRCLPGVSAHVLRVAQARSAPRTSCRRRSKRGALIEQRSARWVPRPACVQLLRRRPQRGELFRDHGDEVADLVRGNLVRGNLVGGVLLRDAVQV